MYGSFFDSETGESGGDKSRMNEVNSLFVVNDWSAIER